jgi:YVTN family beta-propeller protein
LEVLVDVVANTVIGSRIAVGIAPEGVAVTPDGSKVYVVNSGDETVSVIDTATNTVTGSPIRVGPIPAGVAITPSLRQDGDGERGDKHEGRPRASKVFVANNFVDTVSVIDTATNTVTATITVGSGPGGVAVVPSLRQDRDEERKDEQGGKAQAGKVYVFNSNDNTVSVIDAANNTVIGSPIPVGNFPIGVAVTPDGSKVFVANFRDNTASVIATATNTVIGSPIPVTNGPVAFGVFIRPEPSLPEHPAFRTIMAKASRR